MLSHSEWVRINDTTVIIHTTKSLKKFQKYVLDAIWYLVPYDQAMFYLIEEREKDHRLVEPHLVNISESFASRYEEDYRTSNLSRLAGSKKKTMAYKDSQLMAHLIHAKDNYHKASLLPKGIEYGGGIIIADKETSIAEITLFRTVEQGDFTEKELFILEILSKHIEIRLRGMPMESENYRYIINSAKLAEIGLTNREIEITNCILSGMKNAEISDKLNISLYTTKKHITNIYSKLKVSGRRELASLYEDL